MKNRIFKTILLLAVSAASYQFAVYVNDCKVLSQWKPRYGSNKQSCDGTKVVGHVWAKHEQ